MALFYSDLNEKLIFYYYYFLICKSYCQYTVNILALTLKDISSKFP